MANPSSHPQYSVGPLRSRIPDLVLIHDKSAYDTSQMRPLIQLCAPSHGSRGSHFKGPGCTPDSNTQNHIFTRVFHENMFLWKQFGQPALQVFGGCIEGIQKDFWIWLVLGGSKVISAFDLFYIVDIHSALTSQVSVWQTYNEDEVKREMICALPKNCQNQKSNGLAMADNSWEGEEFDYNKKMLGIYGSWVSKRILILRDRIPNSLTLTQDP